MSPEKQTKRTRLRWCLGVAFFITAGIALFVWLNPKLRVDQNTFSLIRRHMTETEIEGLIGGRGSNAVMPLERGEGAVAAWTDDDFHGEHGTLRLRQWRTPDKCIK